jgi:enoyl-CoA hydratase
MSAAMAGADTADAPLLTEQAGPVFWISFNRPARLNAATAELEHLLLRSLQWVDEHPEIRVVVLRGVTGAKPAFMAGGDITEFQQLGTAEEVRAIEQRAENVLDALERLRVPVVAALDGPVIGQGALIAACCDVLIAGPDVKFGFPIARTVGNALSTRCLDRMVSLMGLPMTRAMIMRAQLFGTDDLVRVGAVHTTVAAHDELVGAASQVAEAMAALAPLTLSMTKASLLRLRPPVADNEEMVIASYLSDDAKEAQAAFFEKRHPQWRGC